MFFILRIFVNGVNFKVNYMVLMDIVFVDDKCYRYVYYCLIWFVVGKVDLLVFVRFYMYLDLFFIGE